MAKLDKFIDMMVQRKVERAVLIGGKPLQTFTNGQKTEGAVIAAEQLNQALQEVTPPHLRPQLDAGGSFHFRYDSPQGPYEIGAETFLGAVQITLAPAKSQPSVASNTSVAAPQAQSASQNPNVAPQNDQSPAQLAQQQQANNRGCLFGILYFFGLMLFVPAIGNLIKSNRDKIPGAEFLSGLFTFLGVVAFVCLVVGLIAPTVYSRLLKTKATRVNISYIFVTALFFCLMVGNSTLSDAQIAANDARKAEKAEEKSTRIASRLSVQSETEEQPKAKGVRGLVRKFGDSDYVIRVSGKSGLSFSGSYMTTTTDGTASSKSVDGTVPAEYPVSGNIVSVAFQKQSDSADTLKVEIVKEGRVVSNADTSAAYGMVSAATN